MSSFVLSFLFEEGINEQNVKLVLQDLQEHYVNLFNVNLLHYGQFPISFPLLNKNSGKATFDSSSINNLNRLFERYEEISGAKLFLEWFMHLYSRLGFRQGLEVMSPEWKEVMNVWLTTQVASLKDKDLDIKISL